MKRILDEIKNYGKAFLSSPEWTYIDPYQEPVWTCPKCLEKKRELLKMKYAEGKLEMECMTCGYKWKETPADDQLSTYIKSLPNN